MKKQSVQKSFAILLSILYVSCTQPSGNPLTDKVDMMMGNRGSANCVIGPQLPHASINPSPQTPNGEHDGYRPGEPVRGFGQLHVSGTGWGRYGQILLSPQTGFNPAEDGHDSPVSAEEAKPYYYAVHLDRYNIKVEITPTHHCAAYRITFPESTNDGNILFDIAHNIPQHIMPAIGGKFLGGEILYDETGNRLTGWGEYAGGFGSEKPYKVFFAAILDVKPQAVDIVNQKQEALYAQVKLPASVTVVNLKIAVSLKSIGNANRFLSEQAANRTFEQIKEAAKQIWEQQLSAIQIEGGSDYEQRLFYTALYNAFLMPRNRTGDHPHWDDNQPHWDDHYCIWDTWRTKYPLMILLNESLVASSIQSFINRFEHNKICRPTFTSSLDGPDKQGGDDVDNVIADAFVKDVKGFDREKAYQLIKWNAFNERSEEYIRLGWQPEQGKPMSCSYAVEFAYNDYCTSVVAGIMNDTLTGNQLRQRSESWEHLFNPEAESHGMKGFINPRKETGEWSPIDPAQWFGSWVEYFYEGNAWTYTLFVPHQIERLITLCGGKEEMVRRLTYGLDNRLITMGNEPGFLAPFLFSHCERPDLTAKYVSELRKSEFSLEKGYSDNDDSGALSSWYVFTSIGLFPNAGQDLYYLIPPAFEKITLRMENGHTIRIRTIDGDKENRSVKSIQLNGKPLDRTWIRHSELKDGAEIVFILEKNN